jgi:tight adherence protein B
MILAISVALFVMALGGAAMAFASAGGQPSQKRLAQVAKPVASGKGTRGSDSQAQRRKNVQTLLKDIEAKNEAKKKEKITLKRRLEMAGFPRARERTFWIVCAAVGVADALICVVAGQSILIVVLSAFSTALGLPRWVLSFLKARREKAFTNEFANAIDVIVRSVKSGLPTNEALRIVAKELPEPVAGEFNRLCEGMKVGVTLEQGLKKMYESMPTTEVSFFGIVMSIQAKAGGNLSEALSNLSGVLRDRKRLLGKIKAMSSEAKASAMIIGSLPPGVMGIVYVTTPDYISLLFTERLGNLMLAGCAFWMGCGIAVMRQMINFKH